MTEIVIKGDGNVHPDPRPQRPTVRFNVLEDRKAIPLTKVLNRGLDETVVSEIKEQKTTGKFSTIAGRPWWVSTFSADELKKAGLL